METIKLWWTLQKINSKDSTIRFDAINDLSTFKDPKAIDAIIHLLRDSDAAIRGQAARSLAGVKHTQVLNALVQSLKDENPAVQLAAATSLAKSGDARGENVLVKVLQYGLKESVIDDPVLAAIIRRNRGGKDSYREQAVYALCHLGGDQVVKKLANAIEEDSVADALVNVLEQGRTPLGSMFLCHNVVIQVVDEVLKYIDRVWLEKCERIVNLYKPNYVKLGGKEADIEVKLLNKMRITGRLIFLSAGSYGLKTIYSKVAKSPKSQIKAAVDFQVPYKTPLDVLTHCLRDISYDVGDDDFRRWVSNQRSDS